MKKRYLASLVTVSSCAILAISGCGPAINTAEFTTAPMQNAAVLPSKSELDGAKPKVAIFDIKDSASSASAQAGNIATATISNILASSKIVNVVDKSVNNKLQEEISLAAINKQNSSKSSLIADFVVFGDITNAGANSRFEAAKQTCDINGYCTTTPAKCINTGYINGSIKIFDMSNFTIASVIDISGNINKTIQSDYCSFNSGNLISDATNKAAQDSRVKLLNFFSPKGYITEKKVKSDGSAIFLAQFGSTDGVKFNDNVKIFKTEVRQNPLGGKKIDEEILLGEAKVSNQVGAHTCWIYVEDAALASNIRLGDYVKLEFERSLVDSFHDIVN